MYDPSAQQPLAMAQAMPMAQAMEMTPQPSMFAVMIPDGVFAGQPMQVTTPDGQLMQVAVPGGYGPGMQMQVQYMPQQQAAPAPMAMAMATPMGGMQQGGMQQMMPQQQMMGGQCGGQMMGAPDGFQLLQGVNEIRIMESINMMEVLVGFEMPNKYILTDTASNLDLFVAAEKSDGVMGVLGRQFFEGESRPFNMEIAMMMGNGNAPAQFIRMERPFKCTCCCFQRPEVFMYEQSTNRKIGSVVDPYACCMMTFDLKDADENAVLQISHNPCSCALMCFGCPCGCQEVDFEVKGMDGNVVGHIKKEFRAANAVGMVTGVQVDADQYKVEFQDVQHPEWKAMLLATALFLDYRFFTKGGQSGREGSVLGQAAQHDIGGVGGAMGPLGGLYGAN